MDNSISCSFTGNRPQKLPWGLNEKDPRCVSLKKRLEEEIQKAIDNRYRHFISGMALGVDQYAAKIVLQKSIENPCLNITFEAAIPCKNQQTTWAREQQLKYLEILAICDKITTISKVYTDTCMMDRNKYMIDNCSLLIAVSNGTLGGTMKTIEYAKQKHIEIIVLTPQH